MLNKIILITGSSGFIGFHLAKQILLTNPDATVVGFDNMNHYYDVRLKEERLRELLSFPHFIFVKGDLSSSDDVNNVFERFHPNLVIHLAAQAGVRYSITNPDAYIQSNVLGFYHILEACRKSKNDKAGSVQHLIFASSSSVYGSAKKAPFRTRDKTDEPVSLYAATKKSNELFAHAYAKLFGIPITGLRFFTVYGPQGRPDMAYFGFSEKLRRGEKIQLFNEGKCKRDFTYIDDVVEGILRVMNQSGEQPGESSVVPFDVYNLGKGHPEDLMDFVSTLCDCLKKEGVLPQNFDLSAHVELVPAQPGDVPVTFADMTDFEKKFGYMPKIDLKSGLSLFAQWYAKSIQKYPENFAK